MKVPTSYKVAIFGLLALAAIIYPKPAHANIGDSRADSAKRYGEPTGHSGNYERYSSGNWWINEWFNSVGYAVDVCYYKKDGTITKKETAQLQVANIPTNPSWYKINAKGDPKDAVGQIWLSDDNAYRYESGSTRLFDDKRWFSYLELATITGHQQMVTDNQQQQQSTVANSDYLPL